MPAPVSTSTPPARPYPTVCATPVCASWVPFDVPVDGKVVGTLGVIGPTRMPYDRMIQIVDITAKLVSNALSHK